LPCQTPLKKIVKPVKNELLFYVIRPLPKRYQEIINTLKEGKYKTRYDLNRFHGSGNVSGFIKLGIEQGFLKQKWIRIGTKHKALLELVY